MLNNGRRECFRGEFRGLDQSVLGLIAARAIQLGDLIERGRSHRIEMCSHLLPGQFTRRQPFCHHLLVPLLRPRVGNSAAALGKREKNHTAVGG